MMNFLIIFSAKYLIALSVLGLVVYFFTSKKLDRKRFLIYFGLVCVFSFIIAKISSYFIYDPRPFVVNHFMPLIPHANDNGFPSDHTLLAMAIAMSVYFYNIEVVTSFAYNKKWGIGLFILGVLIGLSRVVAGVHHIEDILGSIVIAGVVAVVINYIYLKINKNN